MANIELVIKIPEKAYNALAHTEFDANLVVDEMRNAITNGTPLPKGHDRLIYAKDVGEYLTLADVPTIIGADYAEIEEKIDNQ